MHPASHPLGRVSRVRLLQAGHEVQCLQGSHGAADPPVRQPGLRPGLSLNHGLATALTGPVAFLRAAKEGTAVCGSATRAVGTDSGSQQDSDRQGQPRAFLETGARAPQSVSGRACTVPGRQGWNGTGRLCLPQARSVGRTALLLLAQTSARCERPRRPSGREGRRGRVGREGACGGNQAVRLVSPLRPASLAIAACAAASRAIGTR